MPVDANRGFGLWNSNVGSGEKEFCVNNVGSQVSQQAYACAAVEVQRHDHDHRSIHERGIAASTEQPISAPRLLRVLIPLRWSESTDLRIHSSGKMERY